MKSPTPPWSEPRSPAAAAGFVAACLVLSMVVGAPPAVSLEGTAGGEGSVVYASDTDGDHDLWLLPPGGGNPTQLANLIGDDTAPRWSPDGTRIAFVKNSNSLNGRLWVVDSDGTGATAISSVQTRFAPAWSPDGSRIAFMGHTGDGDFDLHVVAPDGTGQRKVADTAANERDPAWLDEGIVVDRGSQAVVVDPDTGLDLAAFAVGNAFSYDVAPDGIRVAFGQTTGTGVSRVAVLDTSTGTVTGVTDGTSSDGGPTWAPDGTELIFNRRVDPTASFDLYRTSVDGTGLTRLTAGSADEITPDWYGPAGPPPVSLVVAERLGVADSPGLRPSLSLLVSERVGVADSIVVRPPVVVVVAERVGVVDQVVLRPPVALVVSERVGVADGGVVRPPVALVVSERVGVADLVVLRPPVALVVSERVGVADGGVVRPPVALVVSERVGVADRGAPVVSVVEVVVPETVGVTDTITFTTVTTGTLSTTTLEPGGTYEFGGTGFAPGSYVDVGLESVFLQLVTTTAAADGSVAVTVTIPSADELPAQFAGEHSLVARGTGPTGLSHEVRTPVRVLAPVEVSLDDRNPAALTADVSGEFSLTADFSSVASPLTSSDPDLSHAAISLEPIGPGPAVQGDCAPASGPLGELTCRFSRGDVPVDTYVVVAAYDGDDRWYGVDEGLLTVQDADAGHTSGGGWFLWPTTGQRTHVGFTISHNRKGSTVRGSFTMLWGDADGTRQRLRSNAVDGHALGADGDVASASFHGRATVTGTSADGEGNHRFVVRVEDGSTDRFWIEVRDRDDDVLTAVSMPRPAADEAVALAVGQITVPTVSSGRGRTVR